MYAKKSLGQHFLKSTKALKELVLAGELTQSDTVLEIGPGEGALTRALLATGATVVAIEKDERMREVLEQTFKNEILAGKLQVYMGDVLEHTPVSLGLTHTPYKLIANIPYYITGAIIRKFLEETHQPERMVLLVQKEVALRMAAKNGEESILSVAVGIYGTPKYIATVPRGAFAPAPKVDSAIIALTNISRNAFGGDIPDLKLEKLFFDILHTGFAHKRKFALRNCEKIAPRAVLEEVWKMLNLDPTIRAEKINKQTWLEIANALKTRVQYD